MSGRSFKGDIYIGLYNSSGVFTGYLPDILNVDELSFTAAETESQDRISHKRLTDGQTLDSYSQVTGASTMSLSTDEQLPQIMAANLLGDVTDLDVSSGSVTDESVVVYLDKWTKLANVNISETPAVVADDGSGTTYTEDTDFEIDYRTGMIRGITGGAIGDGDTVEIDYSFDAISGYSIVGQTNQDVRVRIYGDMVDRVTGKRGDLIVHDVRFRPSESVNLMLPDGFLNSALEGRMITPSGESGPFRFREYA